MTNAQAVVRIVSRVAELGAQHQLPPVTVATETDGTTTFQLGAISVHLFESGRELNVRGPGSGRAVPIDPDNEAPGQLSEALVAEGAQTIIRLLRAKFPT